MATSSTYGDDIDTDMVYFKCSDSLITCQICMDIFESPRILPCQHTFCKKCVVSLVTKHCLDDDGNTSKASFPCPNCRRDCKIRQKGKHSIEEHLKCFPESLLLNTVLESIEEKQDRNISDACKRTKHDDENENNRQSYVTILFYIKLLEFLRDLHFLYSKSLTNITKSVYVYFFKELIEIPCITHVTALYRHPIRGVIDIQNNEDEVAEMIERDAMSYITYLGLYEHDEYEIMHKDAQTQTDEEYVNFRFLTELFFRCLLLKDSSLVTWLLYFLIGNPNVKSVDFSFQYTLSFRKIRFWLLFDKVFDILTMLYASEQSILITLCLIILCYLLLLGFFKRIKKLVSGGVMGVNIGNTLPLFPLFLISLNFLSNLARFYLYVSCIVYSYYWLLGKLLLFEILQDIIPIIVVIIFSLCGKMHLIYQYGPFEL